MAEKEGLLPLKLIEDETGEVLTSYGGLPLVVETCEAFAPARRFCAPSERLENLASRTVVTFARRALSAAIGSAIPFKRSN